MVECFHDITGFSRDEWFCTSDPVGHKLGSGGGSAWLLWESYTSPDPSKGGETDCGERHNASLTSSGLHSKELNSNGERDNASLTSSGLHSKELSSNGKEGQNSPPLEGAGEVPFTSWLASKRRLLLHAGGQSRRLPAYAPSGKILTPIPVFRWERGQRLSQDLLSLQIPLYERIMEAAPERLHTMIVSGDVYIRATQPVGQIPDADVVCFGLWLDAEIAKNHGVFVCDRKSPSQLKCMLQKPSVQTLGELQKEHFYLTDIGVWLLSDRAVEVLMKKTGYGERGKGNEMCPNGNATDASICTETGNLPPHSPLPASRNIPTPYDLYGEFGCALGTHPTLTDDEVNGLSVAVLPLQGGEFYHFGSSREIISSTLAVQNLVNDQREVLHHSLKPHPSMFVQNAETWIKITESNRNLWIENSCVSEHWTLEHDHIITGVPENAWHIALQAGQCVDIVPVGETQFAVRPYGMNDVFRGDIREEGTQFIGRPFAAWAEERQISLNSIENGSDLQAARIFPVVENESDTGLVLRWMLNEPGLEGGKWIWERARKMSADDISDEANLLRLTARRRKYRTQNWSFLARNHQHSVFYQVDLEDAAREFADNNIAAPHPLDDNEPQMIRIHDAMFRSELAKRKGLDGSSEENKAFALLREGLTTAALADKQSPRMSVYRDQIVWGRSPVRIDIAGGWTDTPPFCLMEGGSVVNLAIELNGQPPLQAYVKPCSEPQVMLRSIDLGASEIVTTYEQLADFRQVGSPFAIPKAAMVLAGFHPDFSEERFTSLEEQLKTFGCGVEITLLSAIPAGSGLGTSSLLAATVLGALNDFCGLGWDKNEIGSRTLVLEQLLTTGGGWQDQYGGLLGGVKLLQTERGFNQQPVVRWLPTALYTQPEYRPCHLLYYTGITRTAKQILAEIVRKMFLNQGSELALLREMKDHAAAMYEAIQRNDFETMGRLIGKTWKQKQLLDSGTNPAEVKRLTELIADLCLGYKLPGAGGGGYLYMVAKDADAAARIKQLFNANRLNANARFVDMSLSMDGLQVSRS